MRKFIISAVACLAMLGGAVGVNSQPANASTCNSPINSRTDHGVTYLKRTYSHTYTNEFGDTASNRSACTIVWISGDPNSWWQFNVRVQDTVDTCPSGTTYHSGAPYHYTCDDGGYAAIEFNAFGTGWQTAVADTNSADFNYNDGNNFVTYSSAFHNAADGDTVSNYQYRFSLTGHFKLNNYSYQYYTNWSGAWSESN